MVAIIRAWLRRKAARHWPSAEATVQSTGVSVTIDGKMPREIIDIQSAGVDSFLTEGSEFSPGHRGRAVKVWFVRVSYSFTAGGERYGGYADRQVSSQQAGGEYARGLQGKTFPVRYQAGNPDNSLVLDEEWIAAIPSESEGRRSP